MDKFGGNPCTGTSGLASLRFFFVFFYDLVDVFRQHNPLARWFGPDSSIGVRIDRFYLTQDILRTSTSSAVEFFPCSDHDGTLFKLTPSNTPKRGPGYWKLNTSLLGEQILQNQIKSFWTYWQSRKPDFENLNVWWDKGKLKMKDICKKFSKTRAKAHKTQQKVLEKELDFLLSSPSTEETTKQNFGNSRKARYDSPATSCQRQITFRRPFL